MTYDPHLKDFVDQIRQQMTTAPLTVYLARLFQANLKVHHVARAIVGHMFAAHSVKEVDKYRSQLGANDSLRKYFLEPESKFPDDWRLYCWPNFYRDQVILRHFAVADMGFADVNDGFTYGHILKFLPLGFWLVHEQRSGVHIPACEITPTSSDSEEQMRIVFDANEIYSRDFPAEAIGNNVVMFNSEQGSIARPK